MRSFLEILKLTIRKTSTGVSHQVCILRNLDAALRITPALLQEVPLILLDKILIKTYIIHIHQRKM